ncbi:MAG: DUF1552 domain-containing protein [Synechococcus sp.]|nr:DUF1552 domain-containing protein [Synechococcus sp.]
MINRRRFLYSAGCAIALPYLESLSFGADETDKFKRMVIVFSPNGMNMESWNLKQDAGHIQELSPTLMALQEHQEDIIVYGGLAQTKARANGDGGGDHARSMSTFLTGVQIKKTDGTNITAGISADQIASNFFKKYNRIPSLQVGLESGRTAGNCDSGYSCAYSSTISWSNPSLPLPIDTHPQSVFNRIYGDGKPFDYKKRKQRQSILDFSIEQTKTLNTQLNDNDKRKLDEYLNSVREIERRIELESKIPKEPDGKRIIYNDKPEQFVDHAHLLIDLLVLSLQTDSTRVVTLTLGNEGSNRAYPEIEVRDGHHNISHHQNDETKLNDIAKIDKYHTEQVAYLYKKLKEANIFDETVVAFGCGIEDGNAHRHHNLPIVIGGGGLKGNEYIKLPEETPLNNLWLGILNHIGVNINDTKLGDSTDIIRI